MNIKFFVVKEDFALHFDPDSDSEKKIKKCLSQLRDNRKDRQEKNAKTTKKKRNKTLSDLCEKT